MRTQLFSSLVLIFCLTAFAAIGEEPAAAFRAECANISAVGEGMTLPGADGWLFLRAELRHIGVGPAAGRIDAVQQEFYTQLATKGVKVLDLADAFRQGEGQRAGPVL